MQPGTQLGSYEVLSVIGKGGMGEVWKARDQKLDREVAIKTLPEEVVEDARGLERFEREARLLASLNHQNIASIYGLEEAEGTRFLVLELVEGETLEERLKRGPIAVDEAIGLALQLIAALESAHERDVIHRDLKPSNIKITPEGKLKVLDFGLAKALAAETSDGPQDLATVSILATQRGMILGTPGYMSPEQARGEPTDRRTDIWSFGCVFFEMLTGRQSFGGNTMSDALASVIARDPEWSLLPANLHPRIRHLLGRCLEKDVRKRYHDVSEARIELETVLADPAGVYGAPRGAPSPLQWLGWALFAAAGLALVALAFWRPELPSDARPVSRFVASSYPSPQVDVGNTSQPMLAMSPDGTQIAYPVVAEGDVLSIYLRGMNQLQGVRLRSQGRMHEPFYSPEGDLIGFVDSDEGALKRVAVAGTERPETIYAYDQGRQPRGASWGEDGHIVFSLVNDGRGLLRVPEVGGAVEELTVEGPQDEHTYPEVLPGGRGILFTSETPEEGAQIKVFDLDRPGEPRALGLAGSQARYMDPGILVYNDRGVLRAVGFDPESLRVLGTPVAVLEDVEFLPGSLGAQFAVSRSGSLAYLNRTTVEDTGTRTLAIVTPTGVENLDVRPGAYQHPRVSPDESEIAVQTSGPGGRGGGGGIVWIYDRERRALRQLTQEGSNVRPIWHPHGERVAFASNRDGTWGIYSQAADGSDVATRLTEAAEGRQHYPDSFSPDGRYLAYTDINPNYTLDQSIWIKDLETDAPADPLSSDPDLTTGGLEFSVDGDWIAYRENQQIYVQPFPRTGVIHQITQDGGSYPVWSSNGRQLLYRRTVQAGGSPTSPLVTVDVTTDGRFTFGNEQVLAIKGFFTFFGYRDYDFIDDGRALVMVFPADVDDISVQRLIPRVNVVRNWVEEIRSRLTLP